MFTYPAITAALADEHRRDLTAQAATYRLARAVRNGQPTRPGRSAQPRRITGPVQAIRRAVTAIAAAAAATMLVMTPAGAATHHSAHVFYSAHVFTHHFSAPSRSPRWA
jgi:hypothetical protein